MEETQSETVMQREKPKIKNKTREIEMFGRKVAFDQLRQKFVIFFFVFLLNVCCFLILMAPNAEREIEAWTSSPVAAVLHSIRLHFILRERKPIQTPDLLSKFR